jgi:hypothetical protein
MLCFKRQEGEQAQGSSPVRYTSSTAAKSLTPPSPSSAPSASLSAALENRAASTMLSACWDAMSALLPVFSDTHSLTDSSRLPAHVAAPPATAHSGRDPRLAAARRSAASKSVPSALRHCAGGITPLGRL